MGVLRNRKNVNAAKVRRDRGGGETEGGRERNRRNLVKDRKPGILSSWDTQRGQTQLND